MIWFTSDNHFGHHNIVEYCGRPLTHEQLMHQGWSQVGPLDTFIHLGDIVFRRRRDEAHAFLDEHIPGLRKILIEGNHDGRTRVRTWEGWNQVVRYQHGLGMDIDGVQVMMSHRPQDLEVHLNCDVQIVIHGHIHDLGNPWRWRGDQLWVNVCVEQWNYRPVSWKTIERVWKLHSVWKPDGGHAAVQ